MTFLTSDMTPVIGLMAELGRSTLKLLTVIVSGFERFSMNSSHFLELFPSLRSADRHV